MESMILSTLTAQQQVLILTWNVTYKLCHFEKNSVRGKNVLNAQLQFNETTNFSENLLVAENSFINCSSINRCVVSINTPESLDLITQNYIF